MKSQLVRLYRSTPAARALLALPRYIYNHTIKSRFSDEEWARVTFRTNQGRELDLESPTALNDKIQWLKLHYHRPDYSQWADKLQVRELIHARFGEEHLIPLLAQAENPDVIDFENLAPPYIVKPTHTSGQLAIVRKKADIDSNRLRNQCRSWLKTNLYNKSREFHYKDIPPRIIVEQLLTNEDGAGPFDYKFHCIHGKVECIQVDIDRHIAHKRNFYTADWEALPFVWSVFAGDQPLWPRGREIPRPESLEFMREASARLAANFPYARIDWYYCRGQVYFGEVTFFHGGGFERISPVEWDYRLGDKLSLPAPIPHS